MPSTRDQIYALAKKKRNRNNLEAVQEMLTELREHADTADTALGSLCDALVNIADVMS